MRCGGWQSQAWGSALPPASVLSRRSHFTSSPAHVLSSARWTGHGPRFMKLWHMHFEKLKSHFRRCGCSGPLTKEGRPSYLPVGSPATWCPGPQHHRQEATQSRDSHDYTGKCRARTPQLRSLFGGVFFNQVSSPPNMGLEATTPRSRVKRSPSCASQVPRCFLVRSSHSLE